MTTLYVGNLPFSATEAEIRSLFEQHGKVDSVKIIWNGVPEKGMITWKTTLNPQQIHAVASYIYTMRGTSPKNPKPPENIAPAKTGPSEYE